MQTVSRSKIQNIIDGLAGQTVESCYVSLNHDSFLYKLIVFTVYYGNTRKYLHNITKIIGLALPLPLPKSLLHNFWLYMLICMSC